MPELWLPTPEGQPHPERIRGNSAGTYPSLEGPALLLLHTVEGGSIDGAVAAYRANNSWPHWTADFDRNVIAEHVPMNEPARSLRNKSGGVETNRRPWTFQVEIIGFAARMHLQPAWWLERLGRFMARVWSVRKFRLEAPLRFLGQGDGLLATEHAKQRMTFPQWNGFDAVCGHQHAPENTHWDPGRLNVAAALATAIETTGHETNPEESLRMDAEVKQAFAAIRAELDTIKAQMDRKPAVVRSKKDKKAWIIGEDGRRHVRSMADLNAAIYLGQVQGFGTAGIPEVDESFLEAFPIIDA